jgi:hypothetical protein
LIAAGIVAAIGVALGLVLLIIPGLYLLTRWALIPAVILRAVFEPLPNFLATWIGGIVAHSVTTPFIAAVGAVMYFRLARLSTDLEPATQLPEA